MWGTDFVKFTGIGSYTMKFFALGSRSRVRGSLDRISFSTLGEKEWGRVDHFLSYFFFLFIFLFSFSDPFFFFLFFVFLFGSFFRLERAPWKYNAPSFPAQRMKKPNSCMRQKILVRLIIVFGQNYSITTSSPYTRATWSSAEHPLEFCQPLQR